QKVSDKKTPLMLFREKLINHSQLKENLLEGLKSTNAKVRSLASKVAFKTHEHDFVKKNVLPLINSEKSKKVLRTISGKITRKDLVKKVASLLAKKEVPQAKPAEAATPAAAPAEKG